MATVHIIIKTFVAVCSVCVWIAVAVAAQDGSGSGDASMPSESEGADIAQNETGKNRNFMYIVVNTKPVNQPPFGKCNNYIIFDFNNHMF